MVRKTQSRATFKGSSSFLDSSQQRFSRQFPLSCCHCDGKIFSINFTSFRIWNDNLPQMSEHHKTLEVLIKKLFWVFNVHLIRLETAGLFPRYFWWKLKRIFKNQKQKLKKNEFWIQKVGETLKKTSNKLENYFWMSFQNIFWQNFKIIQFVLRNL